MPLLTRHAFKCMPFNGWKNLLSSFPLIKCDIWLLEFLLPFTTSLEGESVVCKNGTYSIQYSWSNRAWLITKLDECYCRGLQSKVWLSWWRVAYGKWHANLSCDRYTLASIQCLKIGSAEDSKIGFELRVEFVITCCSECNVNLSKTYATKWKWTKV
jgi:hypothetical protein